MWPLRRLPSNVCAGLNSSWRQSSKEKMRISIESGVKPRVVRYMENAKVKGSLKLVHLAEFSLCMSK